MSSCVKCKETVTDYVLCGQCGGHFHYGCAGIAENSYRKMGTEKKAAWKCITCRNSTSVENSALVDLVKEIRSFREDFNCMKTDFDTVKSDIHTVKSDIHIATKGIQDLTQKWNELDTRFNEMEGRLTLFEEKITGLSTVRKELTQAKETILELKHTNNLQDQFSRQNNLEILGVPTRSGENLNIILSDICRVVGFTIQDTDVDTIHRVRPFSSSGSNGDADKQPTRHPSIVVRFTQRCRKDQLLAAARARRGLTTAGIGISGPASDLYLNDHLTPTNKLLLRRARELKSEHNYAYLWVRDSKILMRKNERSSIIRITNESDLKKIK